MFKRFITAIFILLFLVSAYPARAEQHDHQQWNVVNVGRLVTLARMEDKECGGERECSIRAAQQAISSLNHMKEALGCRSLDITASPTLATRGPLNDFDKGPLVMAEQKDMSCTYSPKMYLFPVEPHQFTKMCSRVGWKCDVVWISDGDPSVWYINRVSDIPFS